MAEPNDKPRNRASLKGKGREILLGQRSLEHDEDTGGIQPAPAESLPPPDHVDPSSLVLTPEEADALLDFSASLPLVDETHPLGVGRRGRPRADTRTTPVSEPIAPDHLPPEASEEGLDWLTGDASNDALHELPDWLTAPESPSRNVLPATASPDESPPAAQVEAVDGDALPLAERESQTLPTPDREHYQPRPEVDQLTPPTPESWFGEQVVPPPDVPDFAITVSESIADEETTPSPEPAITATESVPPPTTGEQRHDHATVTPPVEPENGDDLAHVLVDDERLRKLSLQIEALLEDLVRQPGIEPQVIEAYQNDLQRAEAMLHESRSHYDDARAIVFRIRAEINRQRKTDADIVRYRPLLLNYYIGWVIALGVLSLLKALFAGVGEAVGVTIIATLYYPMLLGAAGAVIAGYVALERHTTRLRDFDPNYISWYLVNPLMGSIMGLLMFLIAAIANEDLLRNAATDAEIAITYLLCLLAGMNQTTLLRQISQLFQRVGRSGTA